MNSANPGGGIVSRVAFQGEIGAFSEEAVLRYFGEDAEPVACREFRHVGEAVVAGTVDFGMLPAENSIAGTVTGSYDVIGTLPLRVVGEVVIPIHHCVLSVPGARLDSIERVLSHPVALAQCTRFLQARPEISALAVYDTAGAARDVAAAGDARVAAIAARRAALCYGLEVLAADIEDRHDNQTRFFAVERGSGETRLDTAGTDGGTMKVAIVVEAPNRPGALVSILQPFAARAINLTRIDARPAAKPWTYAFFLELEDAAGLSGARAAIAELRGGEATVRVLGVFAPGAA